MNMILMLLIIYFYKNVMSYTVLGRACAHLLRDKMIHSVRQQCADVLCRGA